MAFWDTQDGARRWLSLGCGAQFSSAETAWSGGGTASQRKITALFPEPEEQLLTWTRTPEAGTLALEAREFLTHT
jgi:hypothetical protein